MTPVEVAANAARATHYAPPLEWSNQMADWARIAADQVRTDAPGSIDAILWSLSDGTWSLLSSASLALISIL